MTPTRAPLTLGQRSAALAAATLLGLALLALCWQAAAAQAPAAPAGATWFVNNTPGDGLVGYWKFDQVTNTTTVNSALLTNAASLSNGATISFTNLPPLTIPNLRKLVLNGVNQFLQVPDAAQLDMAPDHFSLAVWARRTTTGTYDTLYDSGTEAGKWWVFIADGSAGKLNHFGFGKRGAYERYSTAAITDANWHHLAVVISGTSANNLTFYVDGAASGTATAGSLLTPTGSKLIGALQDGSVSAQFAGDLDDLRLYNRALSAAEVGRLAQGRGCASDGQSWATAFADLQCALGVATAGDEIWVAKSLTPYRPGTSVFARFNLPSGVGVFGNFAGNETSRAQRQPVNFELDDVTTFSGDLLDNDNSSGAIDDNAENVVQASATGPGTLLDGVRVQDGFNTDVIGGGGAGLKLRSSGQLTVANSLFIQNQALESGAGLLAGSGQLFLDNVTFTHNSAPTGAGAVVLGSAVISGGVFFGNTASDCGGLFANSPALTVSGTLFEFNRASGQGGGACNVKVLTLDGAVFLRNTAGTGGGLHTTSAVTVTNSQFLTNTAAGGGGGVLADSGAPLTLHGGLFAGNAATSTLSLGGAISASGGLAADGVTFVGNTAGAGGALAVDNGPLLITNTQFLANQAVNGDGGALRAHGDGTTLANLLLVGNAASHQGGAVYLELLGANLTQITAVSNTAAVSGSVLFARSTGTTLANSIVWRNGPDAVDRLIGGLNFSFNLGDTGLAGAGNLSADPVFVRAPDPGDGNWATLGDNDYGDLRLTAASPGIDAGNNTLLSLSLPTDLAGQPRFFDVASVPDTGVGTAPIVDMGAYEAQFRQLFLPVLAR
jgi:hypothetical protein